MFGPGVIVYADDKFPVFFKESYLSVPDSKSVFPVGGLALSFGPCFKKYVNPSNTYFCNETFKDD